MTITTVPYRPSKLSQTHPPHSPIPVLAIETRPTVQQTPNRSLSRSAIGSAPPSPPPPKPLVWVWTCHLCHRIYPIGATRRCLEDGHLFCAGVSEVRRPSRQSGATPVFRRHAACSSEFDYAGWKSWGEWRRRQQQQQQRLGARVDSGGDGVRGARGCGDGCDYPSECRWVAAQALPLAVVRPSKAGL
jgi:hypothetical protein